MTCSMPREKDRFFKLILYVFLGVHAYQVAPIFQWLERRTSNPEVVGSTPTWGLFFFANFFAGHLKLLAISRFWSVFAVGAPNRKHSIVLRLQALFFFFPFPLCP